LVFLALGFVVFASATEAPVTNTRAAAATAATPRVKVRFI
jgi:hypothetical protein